MHTARQAAFPARGDRPVQNPSQWCHNYRPTAACMLPTARPETITIWQQHMAEKQTSNQRPMNAAQKPRRPSPTVTPQTSRSQPITTPVPQPARPRTAPNPLPPLSESAHPHPTPTNLETTPAPRPPVHPEKSSHLRPTVRRPCQARPAPIGQARVG